MRERVGGCCGLLGENNNSEARVLALMFHLMAV